jgi:hypothetical protein
VACAETLVGMVGGEEEEEEEKEEGPETCAF